MNWDIGQSVWIWLIFGAVLVLAETVIPGGVIAFLGLAAFIVGLSVHFDWIESWVHALTLWFFSSLVLIVLFRDLVTRLVGGDQSIDNTDEDFDTIGQLAESVDSIDDQGDGRIRFRGTTWKAKSITGTIESGVEVKITGRDNVTYIVEPTKEET